jgi:hypothetical protein
VVGTEKGFCEGYLLKFWWYTSFEVGTKVFVFEFGLGFVPKLVLETIGSYLLNYV